MLTIAHFIEHAIHKPGLTAEEIRLHCAEAIRCGFVAVPLNPCWVALGTEVLSGSGILVGSAVGFPLGGTFPEVKALEALQSADRGAEEIDMVINVGALVSGDLATVERDIACVRAAVPGLTLKVIIEACLLTDPQKVRACLIAEAAGADYVKTSTGYSTGGATVHDVALMRRTVGDRLGVKAAGGIRDLATVLALIDAGATRIGTSSGVSIVEEARRAAP